MCRVRWTLDTLDHPFTFTLLHPLTGAEFERQAQERGVYSGVRGIMPFFHLDGPTQRIGVRRAHLVEAAAKGRLRDPAAETIPDGGTPVYAAHQIIQAAALAEGTPPSQDLLREIVQAMVVLEPVHHSAITGRLRLEKVEDFERHHRWRAGVSPAELVEWLGVDAGWLREQGQLLLRWSEALNDLGPFAALMARAESTLWTQVRQRPRRHLDLRIAGETLLREADRSCGSRASLGRLDRLRMNRDLSLDALLQEFGLSPHPRLVLIVEGWTEMVLLPRTYEWLGGKLSDDFIRIVDREGIDRDISPLVGYIAPKLTDVQQPGEIELERPPTTALVIGDAEGNLASEQDRRKERANLVDRMMRSLPREIGHQRVREQLNELVKVETWNSGGASFEFAHFTDLELAEAIDRLDPNSSRPSIVDRAQHIASVRRSRGSLKKYMKGLPGKGRLAVELWPYMERKLHDAESAGTLERIPAVRVLYDAEALASQYAGGTWILDTRPPG